MQPKLFRMRKVMFITICVIAYNEEQTLPAILKDIAAQDYAHGSMEVVLVDSASSDHMKQIMQEFAAQNTTQPDMGFVSVSVLDNPKRTLPCGWNVALKAYRGEAILKVDAHASIPKDFVTKNVAMCAADKDRTLSNSRHRFAIHCFWQKAPCLVRVLHRTATIPAKAM